MPLTLSHLCKTLTVATIIAFLSFANVGNASEITLTVYHKDPGSGETYTTVNWKKEGSTYTRTNKGVTTRTVNACAKLLVQMRFALKRMVETGYLTKQQARKYEELGIEPEQIKFWEYSQSSSFEEILGFSLDRYESAGMSEGPKRDKVPLRSATIYSVAGQKIDTRSGMILPTKLPWELEDRWKTVSQKHMDRSKYKYVWEWGRAAQYNPNELKPLFAANAFLNYYELLAMGGNLDEAYVMFHSLSKANTRLYLQRHPGTVFPQNWEDQDNTLFLVPLRQVLETYTITEHSTLIRNLIQISNGKLTELEAYQMFIEHKRIVWSELDLNLDGRIQNSPIVIRDLTSSAENLFYFNGVKRGLDLDQTREATMLLLKYGHQLHAFDDRRYLDVTDHLSSNPIVLPQNAVEISNLSESEAREDDQYVLKVILGAVVHSASRAAINNSEKTSIKNEVKRMYNGGVRFAFTTFSDFLSKELEKWGGEKTAMAPNPDSEPGLPLEAVGADWWSRSALKTFYVHIFTLDEILKIADRYPELFFSSDNTLFRGRWDTSYHLLNPDVF